MSPPAFLPELCRVFAAKLASPKPKHAPPRPSKGAYFTSSIAIFPSMRRPFTRRPSESAMFSNETSRHDSGQPLKNSTLPFTSCAIISRTAVAAAHCPSICIICPSPEPAKLPKIVNVENPGAYALCKEPWPGLQKYASHDLRNSTAAWAFPTCVLSIDAHGSPIDPRSVSLRRDIARLLVGEVERVKRI